MDVVLDSSMDNGCWELRAGICFFIGNEGILGINQ